MVGSGGRGGGAKSVAGELFLDLNPDPGCFLVLGFRQVTWHF